MEKKITGKPKRGVALAALGRRQKTRGKRVRLSAVKRGEAGAEGAHRRGKGEQSMYSSGRRRTPEEKFPYGRTTTTRCVTEREVSTLWRMEETPGTERHHSYERGKKRIRRKEKGALHLTEGKDLYQKCFERRVRTVGGRALARLQGIKLLRQGEKVPYPGKGGGLGRGTAQRA